MVTFGMPADPVDNGATTIQSSSFNMVSADYKTVTPDQALNYLNHKNVRADVTIAPRPNDKRLNDMRFIIRNDSSSQNAYLRNLMFWHGHSYTRQREAHEPLDRKKVSIPIDYQLDFFWNIVPVTETPTTGAGRTLWVPYGIVVPTVFDFETGLPWDIQSGKTARPLLELVSMAYPYAAGAYNTGAHIGLFGNGLSPYNI